jgi:diguanylate cyclase (GGDEF)-like protein
MDMRDADSPESKNHDDNALPDALPADRRVLLKTIAPALSVLVGVIAVGFLAHYLQSVFKENAENALRVTLALGALALGVVMSFGHRRQWVLPSIQMRAIIHQIRLGRAAIDEFSKFNPASLADLADEVKLLLQDMRQQRESIRELKEEVRLRIAQRETVLERTIATLRNQIVRDPLTGLFNRRMLEQLLPQLIAQCQNDHKDLTLMMIDIDCFKQFNAALGPAAGDEMLKSIGQIIHSTVREGDFACRYGGDEFVLLLPGCTPQASKRVSDRLDSLVNSLAETYKASARPRLSIGTCSLEELPDPSAAAFLKRADEHLYKVKESRKQTSQSRLPASAA